MARAKLAEIDAVCAARDLDREYRDSLPGYGFQASKGGGRRRSSCRYCCRPPLRRGAMVIAALAADGVGAGHYFSTHLGEQPLFRDTALIQPTSVADALSARMLSLPITDGMKPGDAGSSPSG
jgi:dTDP-4-amino-4,6-dideoxygalactose transaminase